MSPYQPHAPRWWRDQQQHQAAQARDEQARAAVEMKAQQTARQERQARVRAAIRAAAKWAGRTALVAGAVAVGLFMLLVVAFDALAPRTQPRRRR